MVKALVCARPRDPSGGRRIRAGSPCRRSRRRRRDDDRAFSPAAVGVRSTSRVTVSPSSTPRPSTGSYRAARFCSCVRVCSTAFSSSVTAGRRSEIVFSGPGSMGGSVSNVAVNVSACPSSSDTSFTSGVSTGSRPRSRSASSMARGIRSCATSWRICSRNRFLMSVGGTLP